MSLSIGDLRTEFWVLTIVGFSMLITGVLSLVRANLWGIVPLLAVAAVGYRLVIVFREMELAVEKLKPGGVDYGKLIADASAGDKEAVIELRRLVEKRILVGGTYMSACRALATYYEREKDLESAEQMADRVLEKFSGDAQMKRLKERISGKSG